MTATPPFGVVAAQLLAATRDDDFAWLVLADHLDEIGLGDFARIIRDRDWTAFGLILQFLTESGFDPRKMKLAVQFRRKGKFHVHAGWISYRTFYTRNGFAGIRVAFYRENPTPSFLDAFALDSVAPRTRRARR